MNHMRGVLACVREFRYIIFVEKNLVTEDVVF